MRAKRNGGSTPLATKRQVTRITTGAIALALLAWAVPSSTAHACENIWGQSDGADAQTTEKDGKTLWYCAGFTWRLAGSPDTEYGETEHISDVGGTGLLDYDHDGIEPDETACTIPNGGSLNSCINRGSWVSTCANGRALTITAFGQAETDWIPNNVPCA